jgi:hypothetical protein
MQTTLGAIHMCPVHKEVPRSCAIAAVLGSGHAAAPGIMVIDLLECTDEAQMADETFVGFPRVKHAGRRLKYRSQVAATC